MAKGTTSRIWRRTTIVLVVLIVLGFGTVLFSLVKLQLVDGEKLKSQAVENQLKDTTITAQRGTIYDCNMKKLAQSATVWKVALAPAEIYANTEKKTAAQQKTIAAQEEGVAECLNQALGLDKNTVLNALRNHKSSYW
ncbi:MAG: hypothetical protein PHU79_06500, partial [Oscillospiraceae bacterium]|nr:hypothetical protein [Oscillospiraceae bacterium]